WRQRRRASLGRPAARGNRTVADRGAAEPVRSPRTVMAALYGTGVLLGGGLSRRHRYGAPTSPFVSEFPAALQHLDRSAWANGAGGRGAGRHGRSAGAVRRRLPAIHDLAFGRTSRTSAEGPSASDRRLPQGGGRSVRIGGRRRPFPDADLIRALA